MSTGATIPVGYGRILRDEQGNAVDIEFGGEDGEMMDTDRNVEIMDAYVDEKSATTWTQLGPRTVTHTRRPNSVVQGKRVFSMKVLGAVIQLIVRVPWLTSA